VTVGRSGERRLRAVRNNRTRSLRRRPGASDGERAFDAAKGGGERGGERYACGSETAPKGRASPRHDERSRKLGAEDSGARSCTDLRASRGVAGTGTGHAKLHGEAARAREPLCGYRAGRRPEPLAARTVLRMT